MDETDDGDSKSSDSTPDDGVQHDMEKLQNSFPGFRQRYRLIKRIGEGWLAMLPRDKTQRCRAPD
jgi:cell division control protein 7